MCGVLTFVWVCCTIIIVGYPVCTYTDVCIDIDEYHPILINDDCRDPDEKWWIKDLQLYDSDYNVL